jgi:hypothetical protein
MDRLLYGKWKRESLYKYLQAIRTLLIQFHLVLVVTISFQDQVNNINSIKHKIIFIF